MRAKNKPALVGRDGIMARENGKYSILDNFTQRICRSVILTAYSIPYFCEIVKGFETKFEEFLMEIADIYIGSKYMLQWKENGYHRTGEGAVLVKLYKTEALYLYRLARISKSKKL